VNNFANTLAAMVGVFMRWLTFAGRQPVKFWLEAINLERRVLNCE
jgi:hypothetical protein